MTMVVAVKPKPGRLATGSYLVGKPSPITGSTYPASPFLNDDLPVEGGLVMPSDRTQTVYRHPNFRLRDTATQMRTSPLVQQSANSTALVESVPRDGESFAVNEIGPHERGKFFPTKITPVNKTQFGAAGDKASNTAFHPHRSDIIPRSVPVSAIRAGRHNFYPSFPTNNNLWSDPNNSFLSGRANVSGNGFGSGRWSVTKRSVV